MPIIFLENKSCKDKIANYGGRINP